jgi:hypothetical protein
MIWTSDYGTQRATLKGLASSGRKGLEPKCYSILFYSILFYSILFYSILFYSILFCSVLFLFYSILFYSILFYSILFYSILSGDFVVTKFVTSFILNTRLQAIKFFQQFVATRSHETPVTLTIRNTVVSIYTTYI